MKIKKVTEEQEIQNDDEGTVRSEEKAKKLVLEQFHKQIKVFGKKASERMPMKKIQNYIIYLKKGFTPRKRKFYFLFREVREEVREFIQEQTRKGYI